MLKNTLQSLGSKINSGEDDNYLVALDIGTENIKVVIAEFEENELKVLGVGIEQQGAGAMTAGAVSDIARVIESCDKALIKAEEQAKVSPRNTIIGVAGELVKGKAEVVVFEREHSQTEISEDEFERIVGLIQNKALEQAKQELIWETGNDDIDIRIVNSAVVGIEIDGYKVQNPIGFKGGEVKLHVYNAFAPLVHVGALEKIAAELDLSLVTIAAEPYAVARGVLGPDVEHETNSIFVDVGGGTTDVAVVSEGAIDGTMMFGVGGRSFSRAIANKTGLSLQSAEKVKLQYSLQPSKYNDSSDKVVKVKDGVSTAINLWLQGLAVALEDITNNRSMPDEVLFCGGGSSMAGLKDSLSDKDWLHELDRKAKFKVRPIEVEDIRALTDDGNLIKGSNFITALGLLRVGLDTQQSSYVTKIQSKVNKMLKV